jgi:hypothetical protein
MLCENESLKRKNNLEKQSVVKKKNKMHQLLHFWISKMFTAQEENQAVVFFFLSRGKNWKKKVMPQKTQLHIFRQHDRNKAKLQRN